MTHPFKNKRSKTTPTPLRSVIRRFTAPHQDQYACDLPEEIGALPTLLLKLFFKGVSLSPKQTAVFRTLPQDAVIILVCKHESRFEHLFYYTRYQETGHPAPTIAFDQRIWFWQPLTRLIRILIGTMGSLFTNRKWPDPYASGYLRRQLLSGSTGLLSLTGPREFQRRFVKQITDPIRFLIDLQQTIDRPIMLVPHLMMFTKRPEKSPSRMKKFLAGPERQPSFFRKTLTLMKKPGQIFVEISEPVDLKEALAHRYRSYSDPAELSMVIRRELIGQINRHRQAIIGPVLKSRLDIKQNLLTAPGFSRFMDAFAEEENLPIQKVHQKADAYFEEIAANYNPTVIKAFDGVLTWTIRNMFDGVLLDQKGLDGLKRMATRGPLILLPCHKSHIDYLMLSYVMHHNAMPCPHIVAGKNLSFWPMGPIFRNSGAFFIRRTFKGKALYAAVFAAYVAQLLREGFNIEVFIEGGRSRTGKPLTPKTGFLSILLEAFAQGSCDELVLAPVFIGYDKVPEEKAYLHELEGGQKEPESLVQMIRARKFLKKRFGKIYIGFAEPMLLGDLLESQGLSIDSATKEDKEAFCRHIGHRAINAFNRAAVITPHSIMAAALLNGAKDPFTTGDISGITDIYCRHLQFCGAKLSDTLVLDPARSLSQAFGEYLHRKWVERFSKDTPPSDPECRYTIPEAKRPSLDFYKNNGIAPFVPAAFTAMTILSLDAFQFSSRDLASGYRFLQDLFKHEFSFDLEKSPEFFLRRSIKSFIDDAVLMPHPTLPDTYNITSAGLRTLRVFAHFCRPFLEAYSVVVDYLEQHAAEGLSAGEHLKGIGSHGNRMFKRKDVGLKESLSRITFQNALAFFNARGIFGREDNTAISSYGAQIRRYLERFQT